MIRIANGAVERIIREEDYPKWKQAGFRSVDPLPEAVSEADPDPEPEQAEEFETVEIPEGLEKMKITDLRSLAEQIGVQGYQNMDKATLIAVIQNH